MTPSAAALILPSVRRSQVERLRAQGVALGLHPVRVLKSHGRRKGASAALVTELLESGVSTIVIESISKLHPIPAHALALVGALMNAGLRVISVRDGWAANADPNTLMAAAAFITGIEEKRNSKRGRESAAVLRKTGRRVGRPARPLPVPVGEARQAVETLGWRGAARALSISAASIRRALAKADATASKSSSNEVELGGAP